MIGRAGAGGCTYVLEHIAKVLSVGDRYAAFVDLVGELYPPAVAALGVPLQRLLIIRLNEWPLVLRVVETLLRGGATRVVCVDVPPDSPRMRLSTYHRLRRRVRETGGALVFLSSSSVVPADHRIELQ